MEIQLKKISKSFGANLLFSDLSFEFRDNIKTAFVGRNGSGKSTILAIIEGTEEIDSGEIIVDRSRIAVIPQYISEGLDKTVFRFIYDDFSQIISLKKQIDQFHSDFDSLSDKEQERYTLLHDEYTRLDGYDLERRIDSVLTGFGFSDSFKSRQVKFLSGGERRRLLVAATILKDADVLLLDEPTNHLDLKSILWFEDWLKKINKTVLFVSHDRHFINSVADHIVELDNKKLYRYSGNFEKYREERYQRKAIEEKLYKAQRDYLKKEDEFIRRNIAGQKTKQAQSRRKMLDKIEKLEPPSRDKNFSLNFKKEGREGKEVLVIEDLSKSYDDNLLLADINLKIYSGEKVCLSGMNGSGKSTLIRMIIGEDVPDKGSISLNAKTKLGYLSQNLEFENKEVKVIDEFWKYFKQKTELEIRTILGNFLFQDHEVDKAVGVLSGGEKNRFYLAKIMTEKPNFIIMDEPTNHLDLQARILLENALSEFEGTVLFISHDRQFIDEITERIYYLQDAKLAEFYGNITDNLDKIFTSRLNLDKSISPKLNTKKGKKDKSNKISSIAKGANKFKLEKIENRIFSLEEEISVLEKEMISEESLKDKRVFLIHKEKYDKLTKSLERSYQEWENL